MDEAPPLVRIETGQDLAAAQEAIRQARRALAKISDELAFPDVPHWNKAEAMFWQTIKKAAEEKALAIRWKLSRATDRRNRSLR